MTLCFHSRVGHSEMIGVCEVGPDVDGPGKDHWVEMMSSPRKQIAHWYILQESTPTLQLASMSSMKGCMTPSHGSGEWECWSGTRTIVVSFPIQVFKFMTKLSLLCGFQSSSCGRFTNKWHIGCNAIGGWNMAVLMRGCLIQCHSLHCSLQNSTLFTAEFGTIAFKIRHSCMQNSKPLPAEFGTMMPSSSTPTCRIQHPSQCLCYRYCR